MERKNVVGLMLCVGLFVLGFFLQGNIGLYFNLAGILIVVGGTFGATMISFRLKRLEILYQVLRGCHRTRVKEPHEIVEILVDLSVKSRLRGLLSLQEDEDETSILFLRRALGFLVDGYPAQQIKEILSTEMYFFKVRRYDSERVLRTMAEICPAFGLVGSVVGLIGMLAGVADQSIFLKTLPIALTSTLYGVVFANFLFLPLASNIRERTDRELLLQKIIMEGTMAIATELNPRVLEMKLKSFLTPSLRKGRLVSLKRIQEKFKIKAEGAIGDRRVQGQTGLEARHATA
jgi:chemotaxis protein MotA